MSAPDTPPKITERVCSCGKYLCLPNRPVCTVCARRCR
jgi:hypothetical protein